MKPSYSQTILLPNLYQNPAFDPKNKMNASQLQNHFDAFYEDFWCEMCKYGEVEEVVVCDNNNDRTCLFLFFPLFFPSFSPFSFPLFLSFSSLVLFFLNNPLCFFSIVFLHISRENIRKMYLLFFYTKTKKKKFFTDLIGNVYARFKYEDSAQAACDALNSRWYAARPIYCELSPVTDFREACCRLNSGEGCVRGGFCNFIHRKEPSAELDRELELATKKWLRQRGRDDRSKSRSPSPSAAAAAAVAAAPAAPASESGA